MLSINSIGIAKSINLVKVSVLCVIINSHLVAGGATHDCTGTRIHFLVHFKVAVDSASKSTSDIFTDFILHYQHSLRNGDAMLFYRWALNFGLANNSDIASHTTELSFGENGNANSASDEANNNHDG